MADDIEKLKEFFCVTRENIKPGGDFDLIQFVAPADENNFPPPFFPAGGKNFYFSHPESNFGFLAIDSVEPQVSTEANIIIHSNRPELSEGLPLFVGGLNFPLAGRNKLWQDFEDFGFFIPRYLWIKLGAQLYSVINLPASGKQDFSSIEKELFAIINGEKFEFGQSSPDQSEEEYDFEKWNSKVTAALEAINNAGLDKVVLARYTKRRIPSPLDFKTIVAGLENEFPDCYTFAIFSKNSCFFGSTPERLIRISGCNLETEALAGSTKRGSFEEEDLQLEKELIANEKEINEHKSVLGYLVENLKEFSNEIIFSDKPAVKKLKNIQHLWTPVVAKLKGNNSPLRIASKLYPTPAVCGSPKEKALELIARLEEFDRGMYAGIVGWYNHFGRAEFAVTIRSALIKNNYLYAFAGCGIVAGSESYKEFQESELKLKPILSRFRDETISQP